MARYILNEKTGRLHIEGYCKDANDKLYNCKVFDTENAAIEYAKRHVAMCKICEKKKDKLLKEQL